MIDQEGLTLVRKATIRCSLSLNTGGDWEKSQLLGNLQDTFDRHLLYFEVSSQFINCKFGIAVYLCERLL